VILYTGRVLQTYDIDPHLINTFIDSHKTGEKDEEEEEEEEEACSERHHVFTGGGGGNGQKNFWFKISPAGPPPLF